MSGHNKWSKIKRKKGIADAQKGRVFSKLIKTIELAAQEGEDLKNNPSLKVAIDKAKTANMPNSTIERAIKKAAGKADKNSLQEIQYEAYGPGGVAVLIKTVTDNKKRTVAERKHILAKNNGSLAGEGSVKWQFNEAGKPNYPITLSERDEAALNKLLGELDEQEDVQEAFTNKK